MRKKGFTLIEVVLYMGLFAIFMVVMTNIYVSVLSIRLESESISAVEQDGNVILARLIYDINQASSVTTPGSLGTQSSSLAMVINSTNYTYALSGGNMVLTAGANSGAINSYNTTISNFSVLRLGNVGGKHSLQLSFTVTSKITKTSGVDTKNFQTTVALR